MSDLLSSQTRLQEVLNKRPPPKAPTTPHEVSAKSLAFSLDPWWRRDTLMRTGGVPPRPNETPSACIDLNTHFRILVDPQNCTCRCCGEYSGGFVGLCLVCLQRPINGVPECMMAFIGCRMFTILRTEWTVAPHLVRRGTVLAGIFVIWLSSRLTNRLGGIQTPPFAIAQIARFSGFLTSYPGGGSPSHAPRR